MVKKCAWGTCRSDSRYPERLEGGVRFIPFPRWQKTKPCNREKCLRWIKACNRPHYQLNLSRVERSYSYYICSKHFVDGEPSQRYPDPIIATATSSSEEQPLRSNMKASRPTPTDRSKSRSERIKRGARKRLAVSDFAEEENHEGSAACASHTTESTHPGDHQLTSSLGLEMLALASELQRKQLEVEVMTQRVKELEKFSAQERLNNEQLLAKLHSYKEEKIAWTPEKLKKKCRYYTGFSFDRFNMILCFLAPKGEVPFHITGKLKQVTTNLSTGQQFLLVMMKLRQNFDYQHLAELFNISASEVGNLFKEWINYMYFRFGEVPTWPDREILIQNMPEKFRKDFPVTVAILDGTEIKSQRPSALKCQSQFYSDYKASTTLKGLVAVDPRGAFIFISMLFSGSISDKEICRKSGLLRQLSLLLQKGKLLPGDGIMVDKGFPLSKEMQELGLKLWIPPYASSDTHMSAADVAKTKKIAKHRIIVENAIGRAKNFKIIKQTINLNLFPSINQIWFCCCFLTNFMPCLKK